MLFSSPSYFSPATDPKLYRCACGRPECEAPPPSPRLLEMLNRARMIYGGPLRVTSGPRCPEWNRREGGEDPSEHVTGEAADLVCVQSWHRWKLLDALRVAGCRRIGIGRTFVHAGVSQLPSFPADVVWTYDPQPKA